MIRNSFLLHFLILLPLYISGQEAYGQKKNNINYYGNDHYLIEGTSFSTEEKENEFDRLPLRYKDKVRTEVWALSKHSSGLSIRFLTNSSQIQIKWEVLNNFQMQHMAETGIKGIDLYCKKNNHWQYAATAIPQGKINEAVVVENMSTDWKEFQLFLPLYDGIMNLEIGIDSSSQIQRPEKIKKKPIVFYGTSITQGGCASRPGMSYTSIISRTLNVPCTNFGFSGNGRMESEIAEAIAEIDATFYVIDCVANMTSEQIKNNMVPLVEIIRKKRPSTPILFIESITFESAFFDRQKMEAIANLNNTMNEEYKKIVRSGIKNIYYIANDNLIGSDHEATVDGVHFTDLGFKRFADHLMEKFKKYKL